MAVLCISKKRKGSSEVLTETKTSTAIVEVAEAAFWILHGSKQYQSQQLLILMMPNRKQLNTIGLTANLVMMTLKTPMIN